MVPTKYRELRGAWTSMCLRLVTCHDLTEWNCPRMSLSQEFRRQDSDRLLYL